MNRITLVHAAWLVIAVGAFGLGSLVTKSGTTVDPETGAGGPGAPSSSVTAPGVGSSVGKAASSSFDAEGKPGEVARSGSGGLSAGQIQAISREAFTDPSPLKRSLAFARLLESLTPENAQQVMEEMRNNRAGGDEWRLFRYAWGAIDGATAVAYASKLEGRERSGVLSEMLSGWASADPSKATNWLNSLESEEEQARFRGSLVGGLADSDIGLATRYVLERAALGDKQAGDYLDTVASEELRKNGPVMAALWAEDLPDGALKGAALDRVAGRYVNEDPEAAAAWAAQFATADYGARVIEEVGDEWAERDPKAAVSWLESLAESAGRSEGMYSALREWTRRDALAASDHLAAMPASDSKDSAVSGFARTLAYEDPESAIVWAGTIATDRLRIETLTRAGQAWYRRDADAARAWLSSSGLPEEAQTAILNPRRDQGRGRGRGRG